MSPFELIARRAGVTVAAVLLACLCGPGGRRASADEVDAVQQFLTRVGLAELQAIHLEKVLQRDLPDPRRIELARRLADVYAGLLMSESQDEAKSRELSARVDALVKRIPEANTPSLNVLLLQAEYNRAEAEVAKWVRQPDDLQARDAARAILSSIVPRLQRHRQEIDDAIQQAWQQVQELAEDQARTAKEEEASRLETVATRAAFLSGWANYYLALVGEDPDEAKSELATARKCFRSVLALDEDDPLDEISADWFNLEAVWLCRALIGLGMAEAAGGNLAGSRACFDVLQDPDVPPTIRDEAGYWQVQGLVNAEELDEARYLVEQQMREWSGAASPGKVAVCAALIGAGFAGTGQPKKDEARALGLVGIAGLVRLKQLGTLRQLMSQYAIEPGELGGLLMNGLKGQELFDQAEASQDPDDYRAAQEALSAALAGPDARSDVAFAGQCRYMLGWCHYRLGEYAIAAEQFEEAANRLKATDESTAVKAAWSAVESYYQAASDNERYLASADRMLEAIKRTFPDHPLVEKLDYYRAKIHRRSSSPEQLIDNLRRVKSDSPDYLTARYEICLLEHERWVNARGTPDESSLAAAVYQAVDVYLAADKDTADAEKRLKCLLLGADVALAADRVDVPRVQSYLGKATPLAAALPESAGLAAEYRYRSFQLAGETGDDRARRDHADWLARHAAGSGYELPALVELAKEADAAVASARGQDQRSLGEKARGIYARLVELLGDSPEAISSQKNAQVANSKLAEYLSQAGRHAEAAERLDKILAAYPNERGYLRRAGIAHFEAGNYEKSLPHWRKLLAGLATDSVAWYEAKYYQLSCLVRLDKAQAREVFAQFELLHPDFGPEPWREKLKSLKGTLVKQ